MKHFDNRGALAFTKKKLIIVLGAVLGVALIAWGVLMVCIFGKGKNKDSHEIPDGYREVYRISKCIHLLEDGTIDWIEKYTYDEMGRETSVKEYAGGVRLYRESHKKYDENGNLIEYCTDICNDYGRAIRKTVYTYDSNGTLRNETMCDESGYMGHEYIYNAEGIMIEKHVQPLGHVHDEGNYYYDDKGRLLRKTRYAESGEGELVRECTYSESGLLLEDTEYPVYPDSYTACRTIYEYDSSERMVRKQTYHDNLLVEEVICDEEGKNTTYKLSDEDEYEGIWYRAYDEWFDEKGESIHRISYAPDGRVEDEYTCEREYNESGRLTKRIYRDGDGQITSWEELEYNELSEEYGRYLKSVSKWPDGTVLSGTDYEYIRNSSGEVVLIKEKHYGFGKDNEMYKDNGMYYRIDENGNRTMQIIYDYGSEYVSEIREYERFVIPVD